MKWASKIFNTLFGGEGRLLRTIMDKIPNPGDKARLRAKIEEDALALLHQHEEDFRGFVLEYEGRGAEMHWTIQVLRASVRPVLTYVLAGFMVYMVYNWMWMEEPNEKFFSVLKLVFGLNIISLTFWYGEKALQRSGIADWLKNGKK